MDSPVTTYRVSLGKLKLDKGNARTHDKRNIEKIIYSLQRFGQQKPIVVGRSDNVVVAGNGTLRAAKKLKWQYVDVVYTDLCDDERTAYALADNRTNELSNWDHDVLAAQLKELADADVDVQSLGWDPDEMALLVEPESSDDAETPDDFEKICPSTMDFDQKCPKCGYEFS